MTQPNPWTPALLAAVRNGTWNKPLDKMDLRTGILSTLTCSAGRRAAAWNTYMASLVPYPAQICRAPGHCCAAFP